MTKRSTRHSLILSAISLLLCASMLIGTTFAWFTDSVTSTGNIIKSGTLDVSLEYIEDAKTDPQTAADTAWKDASEGAIFNYSNWEPGFVQTRHIKIENEGTLALKYKVNVIPTGETEQDGVRLSDVIDVYYLDPGKAINERTDLDTLTPAGTLTQMLAGLATSGTGTLKNKGDSVILTIALKMQESAGNEYQNKKLGDEFAVQLLATQVEHEDDSFDNKYDIDATFPIVVNEKVDNTTGKTLKAKDNGGKVLVAVDVPAGEAEYELNISEPIVTEENGESTVTLNITLLKDGVEVDAPAGVTYPVTVNVGAGLVINKVLHKSEEITAYNYDVFTGELSFETDSFSPFSVAYREVEAGEKVEISTVETLTKAVELGGTYKLANDIELPSYITVPSGVTLDLDLNGKTITSNNSNVIRNNGTLTIVNGVLDATTAYTINNVSGNVIVKDVKSVDAGFYNAGVMLVENCEITNTISGRHGLYNNANAELVVNGLICSTTSQNAIIYNNNGTLTVNDGTFTQIGSSYMLDGSNITINGGTFNDDDGTWAIRGNGHTIKGGTFNFDPSAYIPEGYVATNNGDGTWTVVEPENPWYDVYVVNEDVLINSGTVEEYAEINHAKGDLTIKNVTFKNGLTIYKNNTDTNGTVILENCTIMLNDGTGDPELPGRTQHKAGYGLNLNLVNGSKLDLVFKKCTFTAPDGYTYTGSNSYNVYIGGGYSANSISFEGCEFEGSGKHGIGCSSEGTSAYYSLSVKGCNFKDWNNDPANTNGAAIRGNLPASDFNADITISGNTFGNSNGSTQTTVAIDSWTGEWN